MTDFSPRSSELSFKPNYRLFFVFERGLWFNWEDRPGCFEFLKLVFEEGDPTSDFGCAVVELIDVPFGAWHRATRSRQSFASRNAYRTY
jgi:hypothetical protein